MGDRAIFEHCAQLDCGHLNCRSQYSKGPSQVDLKLAHGDGLLLGSLPIISMGFKNGVALFLRAALIHLVLLHMHWIKVALFLLLFFFFTSPVNRVYL